jgi:RNA polymerase sigma-70 factor, ECF subfamily
MELVTTAPMAIDLESDIVDAYPALVRRLTIVLRDQQEAQDVAQSTVTRALERRASFRGGDVRAWLYTIGLRLAFNELRRRSVRLRARRSPEEPSWAMATDPDLWFALGRLDPRHRAALLLTTLDGYTHEEVGSMLGVPPGTVSSWLSRTKANLRRTLGGPDA